MTQSIPPLDALLGSLEQAIRGRLHAVRNRGALDHVGGNFAIIVRGVCAWTVVTQPPRRGLYTELTDDEVLFALICEPKVAPRVFADQPQDLASDVDSGGLMLRGDFSVFERFMALPAADTTLTLRLAS